LIIIKHLSEELAKEKGQFILFTNFYTLFFNFREGGGKYNLL